MYSAQPSCAVLRISGNFLSWSDPKSVETMVFIKKRMTKSCQLYKQNTSQ